MSVSLEIYRQLRDNKKDIIKNYYVSNTLQLQEKYFNELDNKDKTEINKDTNNNDNDNDDIYKAIILAFNSSNIDFKALICYTTGDTKYFEQYEKNIYGKIIITKDINENFIEFLKKIAKNDTLACSSLGMNSIKISKDNLVEKIKNRDVICDTYTNTELYPKDESRHNWIYIIYNDVIYNLMYKDQNMYLCKNSNNSEDEYRFFIDFIENEYSPVKNAMDDPKNLPGPSFSPEKLARRKSISEISDIDSNTPLIIQFGKYDDIKHLKYTIRETMACFRNDRDEDGNIIMEPANSNFRREPFIKQVLNFPPGCTKEKDGEDINDIDLELLQKIKSELNNVLQIIKEKYPPPEGKEYFLIDLEGGAGKHFDYSLYAFTKKELKLPQDQFLVKANLWKKLEFKSYEDKKTITGLSCYLSKSPLTLFDTVNSTFGNEFIKKAQMKNSKEWLIKNIDLNEYFANGIENILQGQKDKIYVIWNVQDKKIYLDEFTNNELIIKRIEGKPQIKLDTEALVKKGKIRIFVETENPISTHMIIYSGEMEGGYIDVITLSQFKERNWKGDNRYRREELNKIAGDLNMEIDVSNSNNELYNRIVEELEKIELRSKQKNGNLVFNLKRDIKGFKERWQGYNKSERRKELNSLARDFNMEIDDTNDDTKLYNRLLEQMTNVEIKD